MHKFGKVAITAIITGILALGVAVGVAGLTGKGLAATCGNSDDCACIELNLVIRKANLVS